MIDPKPDFWATVIRWVDGDTAKLTLDTWFGDTKTAKFRVLGINTPEKGKPNYEAATMLAEALAPVGTVVAVRTYKPDSFGRWLAEIQLPDGRSFTAVMLDSGLAVPFVK